MPSKVSYSHTNILAGTFFCHFLQQSGSSLSWHMMESDQNLISQQLCVWTQIVVPRGPVCTFSIGQWPKSWFVLLSKFVCVNIVSFLGGPLQGSPVQDLLHPKLWNQVPSLDHFVVQNSGDFLCWKYKEVVCFYVSNLLQKSATEKSTVNQCRADYWSKFET